MGIDLGTAILHLRSDDSELGRGLQAAERDFNNWWSGLQTMAAGAVTGLVATGVAITRKAVMQTGEYATEVRRMSSITGEGAEATSRMIQVFADFDIQGTALTTMLRTLASQGLSPTIETIAMLSDRYLALAPGVERATFLQDNFGRSGADLAMVMDQGGSALLARNALVESGLVLSQAQLDRAEELRQAEDDLNDAWRAATTTLATAVTPALTGFIQQLGNALTPAHELERVWRLINRATAESAPTWREYVEQITDAAIANGNIAASARDYYIQGQLNNDLTRLEQETLGGATRAQWEHIQAVSADAGARAEDRAAILGVGRAVEDLSYQQLLAAAMEAGLSGNTALESHYRRLAAGIRTARDALAEYIAMAETDWSQWAPESRFVTPPPLTGGGTGGPPGGWAAWEAAHPGQLWTPGQGQHGLSFDVEGPSGSDQVPVNLALSRGEHVEVTPAGEQAGGRTLIIEQVNIYNRDDEQAFLNTLINAFRGI